MPTTSSVQYYLAGRLACKLSTPVLLWRLPPLQALPAVQQLHSVLALSRVAARAHLS